MILRSFTELTDMPRDFFPRRDEEVVSFASNFAQKISLDPGSLGLTPEQAADCSDKSDRFATAFRVANEPSTSTTSTRFVKNAARRELEISVRMLAAIIRANPAVTDVQRISLGLSMHRALDNGDPAAIGKPDSKPSVRVRAVNGRRVKIQLRDVAYPTKTGKPPGIAGARVYCFQGEQPSADLADWRFIDAFTRTDFTIDFGPRASGGIPLWIAACWYSPRGECGAMSNPIQTFLACAMNPASKAMSIAA